MPRRIVLVQPILGYWDRYRNKSMLPMSLLSAATVAAGKYHVTIVDQRVADDAIGTINRFLDDDTMMFGFTACSSGMMINNCLKMSRHIKARSGIPVVWGGPHPSLLPEQTLSNDAVDFVVQGDGEHPFADLADALASGSGSYDGIPGLWYKDNGTARGPGRQVLADLDALPMVPYDLVDVRGYVQKYSGMSFIPYQATRGCARSCNFCYNGVFNKGVFRAKSINRIFEELRRLKDTYKIDGIYFVDDNLFLMGKENIFRLSERMAQLGLKWYLQGAEFESLSDYTPDELLKLSKEGLVRLTFGVESGSPRIRKIMGKRESLDTIRAVIANLGATPIRAWCNYMVNIPTETVSDLRQSIDFIYQLREINPNVRNSTFYKYLPNPGTAMVRMFGDRMKLPERLEDWGNLSWESVGSPVYADYLTSPGFFKSLTVASLLSDKKIDELLPWSRALMALYRPVANFRLRHLYFKYPVDNYLFEKVFPIFD